MMGFSDRSIGSSLVSILSASNGFYTQRHISLKSLYLIITTAKVFGVLLIKVSLALMRLL